MDIKDIQKFVNSVSDDYRLTHKDNEILPPRDEWKSKVQFTQRINDNVDQLQSKKYAPKLKKKFGITRTMWGYISQLAGKLEWSTNALINKKRKKNGWETADHMSVVDIANIFDVSREYASKEIVKRLLKAGILLEFEFNTENLKEYGRVCSKRMLCMNPELYYRGPKNKINPFLAKNIFSNDKLEKAGFPLYQKIWHSANDEYAKLISRSTYLRRKRKIKARNLRKKK